MMIKVQTKTCIHCNQDGHVEMTYDEYNTGKALYEKGALMQEAFPGLSLEMREQLISGTHPKCWAEMWSPRESQYDGAEDHSS